MKKRILKLGLTKSKISNLSDLHTIKGGNSTYSEEQYCIESLTRAIDVCCKTDGGL
ncbi:MAG: hypothetical protein AB8B65_04735 [Kordia sp.]|uniref:hypothetical protein n=1 Tax=Kordia sp. TaxID=1965332 RepID=UPI0038588371